MAKSCNEGTASNRRISWSEGHWLKTWCQQGHFSVESSLKCTLPLLIYTHNINVMWVYWLPVHLHDT